MVRQAINLKTTIESIKPPNLNIPIPEATHPQGPPFIPGLAGGGMVDWGPSGRDATLGRLTRGEFVVNPEATSKFYSQLMSMNSFRGYAEGGLVQGGDSYTIGDITVNVSSANTDEQTARRIGYALERELRRGNIKFNR